MIVSQLPVEKAIEAGGSVIDSALKTSPNTGNGYGIALATPYIFLFVFCGFALYFWHITRKDKKEDDKRKDRESDEKREAFIDLRNDVKTIGDKFEERTQSLENALREDSTAIRGILHDHHTRISILEIQVGVNRIQTNKESNDT